ncbi:MAG: type VI secretion system tip protein TssI/VgrG [Pseudomonadota bacterium]
MAEERFHIKSDSPAAADLMFWSVVGHEALSRPSLYELTVLSKNKGVDAKDVLGHAFDVTIDFQDADGGAHERHCQGHAVRFVRLRAVGRFFEYRITLRSWFGLLAKRTNSRILQDKSVLEVLDAVFEDSPIKRFKKLGSGGVIGTHKSRRYCVQHQESDYRFLSRLLEDAGIYYWFDAHDAPGTMHLADASDVAHDKLPVADTLHFVPQGAGEGRYNEIRRWVSARRFDTGKHAARDSDFKAIRKKVGADIDAHDDHELADLEVFEFPGGYFSGEDADTTARVRGDELQARRDRHWALTRWPDVAVGRAFTFAGDPEGMTDGDYTIAACTFVATHAGYEGIHVQEEAESIGAVLHNALADDAVNADTLDMLESLIADTPELRRGVAGNIAFLLTVLPADMPFRPPRLTPRVTMPGPQSGIVVGPKGDEHHVDDMGRVKVHFHWDRYDESNEKSTCWVRVSQPWAGDGWGGYFAPRIGQEVIVDFLNGDPDRPIIVGRMYNDDQPIPYKSATQSGFKTRSTPGGGSNNYNEIMFEDKKGAEAVNIHAERNMSTSVEVDASTSVGHDRSATIENDDTTTVRGKQKVEIKKTLLHIAGDKVTYDHKNGVLWTVTNGFTGYYGSFHNVKVTGWRHELVTGNASSKVDADSTDVVTGTYTLQAANTMLAGTTMLVQQAPKLEVNAGGGGLLLTSAGLTKSISGGDLHAAAVNFKFVSKANFDRTIAGEANDVVLGANSNAYVGNAADFQVGTARSTFIGLRMDTAIALSMCNVLGAKIENDAAIDLKSIGAAKVEQEPVNVQQAALHNIAPGGGGGGGGGGGAAAASSLAGLGTGFGIGAGILGAAAGVYDLSQALKSYDQAIADLEQDFPEMAKLAARRRAQLAGAAVGSALGPAAFLAGAALGGHGPDGVVDGINSAVNLLPGTQRDP